MANEEKTLKALRKEIFLTGWRGGMAHLASCFSCLEIVYTLYCKDVLRIDAQNARWRDRDRFILSKGHGGLALYAVLAHRGLISWETFHSYLQDDARIGGEPCTRDCEWIEATTGSLGHGLSVGVGMAKALKLSGSDAKVYVLLGDGECAEGTVWEAVSSAGALGLDNLVAILDRNGLQKTDRVQKTFGTENWRERIEPFGWQVRETDGHDVPALRAALTEPAEPGKPLFVIARTVKGKGVSIMENSPNWHFRLPNRKELKVFREELGIDDAEME